jgi:hypothetical protein
VASVSIRAVTKRYGWFRSSTLDLGSHQEFVAVGVISCGVDHAG